MKRSGRRGTGEEEHLGRRHRDSIVGVGVFGSDLSDFSLSQVDQIESRWSRERNSAQHPTEEAIMQDSVNHDVRLKDTTPEV